MKPLPVPRRPWEDLSVHFVCGLPEFEGFDSILVVVDRLTAITHVVPCNVTPNSRDVARVFLDNVCKLEDLGKTIVQTVVHSLFEVLETPV